MMNDILDKYNMRKYKREFSIVEKKKKLEETNNLYQYQFGPFLEK